MRVLLDQPIVTAAENFLEEGGYHRISVDSIPCARAISKAMTHWAALKRRSSIGGRSQMRSAASKSKRGEGLDRPSPLARQIGISAGHSEEACGVLRYAPVAHLEVQVSPGGTASAADVGDLTATQDHVTHFDQQLRGVGIPRHQVVAVVDLDHITILRMHA